MLGKVRVVSIEGLVPVRLRLPAELFGVVRLRAKAAGVAVPDYVRRVLCETVPAAERSPLVAELAAGGQVGRGLARAASATRREVAQAGAVEREARRRAVHILGERFGLSNSAAESFLGLDPGAALVKACRSALVAGRGRVRIPAQVSHYLGGRRDGRA